MKETPIVLFVYNRLELMKRVLAPILAANPSTLILIADGPKPGQDDDRRKCDSVRGYLDGIRTPGEIVRLYSDDNLGAGRRIASGLGWVFSRFEEAIILEDDLLADETFFPFCEELLERYRHQPRVAMISGCNFHRGRRFGEHSYFFSRCVGTWGWATWRRSWQHFDFEIRRWREIRDTSLLRDLWERPEPAEYWRDRFDEVFGGRDDVWDYQWAFSMWSRGAIEVYPNQNLVSHIGCVPDATHLIDPSDPLCNQPTLPMRFPLSHPEHLVCDLDADLLEFANIFTTSAPQTRRS